MKVLHFGTLDVNAGGPAWSAYYTLKGLRACGVDASIITWALPEDGKLIGEGIPWHEAGRPLDGKFCYSSSLKRNIRKLGDFDIYHAQGVWQWPTYAMVDVARKKGRPYLITPRGMLYPQDIAKASTTFKKLSLKWRLLEDLNKAACIHVTCNEEMEHCRNLGINAPFAVIPNPVEIKEYAHRKKDDVFRVGYLGRVSRRKNVEGLIYAFDKLRNEIHNAELLIIGGDDPQYEHFLREEVERLKLKNVRFTGFLSGEEKDKALASCSILAMPSEFENFGNVILEGLIRGIPCVATKGAPWEVLETHHCGWWVDYNQDSITDAICKAYHTDTSELIIMGENGKHLLKDQYSVEAVANSMKDVYDWILGGQKPDCIYF